VSLQCLEIEELPSNLKGSGRNGSENPSTRLVAVDDLGDCCQFLRRSRLFERAEEGRLNVLGK